MVRLTGACAGLLAFSVSVFRGLSVDNSAETILQRAIVALVVFCGIGLCLGWIARNIIVEYALNREKEIMARFRDQTESTSDSDQDPDALTESPGNSTPPKSEPIGA